MFSIPAAELGTSLAVYVDTSTTPNSRFASIGTVPPKYVQIPYAINTVNELKAFISVTLGISRSSIDTIYLPHAEYAAIEADWLNLCSSSASAFKVGDWVTWAPKRRQ